jgi:hypothetical protein
MHSHLTRFATRATAFGIANALLVGCASSGSQLAPTGPMQQSAVRSGTNDSFVRDSNRVAPDAIIYTPTDVTIENSSYNLDLTNNGTTDFTITESNSQQKGCSGHTDYFGSLAVKHGQTGGGVETSNVRPKSFAAALASGSPIGSGQKFRYGDVPMQEVGVAWQYFPYLKRCVELPGKQGFWLNTTAYLGLAFPIRGQAHYGWAQLTVTCLQGNPCFALTAKLTGYAYQTRAGKSIMAGQTK